MAQSLTNKGSTTTRSSYTHAIRSSEEKMRPPSSGLDTATRPPSAAWRTARRGFSAKPGRFRRQDEGRTAPRRRQDHRKFGHPAGFAHRRLSWPCRSATGASGPAGGRPVTSFHFEARDWRDPARLRARVHLVVRRSRVSLESPIIGGTAFRRLHAGLTSPRARRPVAVAQDPLPELRAGRGGEPKPKKPGRGPSDGSAPASAIRIWRPNRTISSPLICSTRRRSAASGSSSTGPKGRQWQWSMIRVHSGPPLNVPRSGTSENRSEAAKALVESWRAFRKITGSRIYP